MHLSVGEKRLKNLRYIQLHNSNVEGSDEKYAEKIHVKIEREREKS